MNIEKIAYEKYKFYWMMNHRITINDFNEIVCIWEKDYESLERFDSVIEEVGFKGLIWPCFEEFLDCEYKDKNLMKLILTESEYKQYLKTQNEVINIYIEIKDGVMQNVYTDTNSPINIVCCDYDNANAESDIGEATINCKLLEKEKNHLNQIY